MENVILSVVNIVGGSTCVDAEEGQKVFELVKNALTEGHSVTLSFLNVEMLAPAFLNTAIGQLYGQFPVKFLKENLKVEDLSLTGAVTLKRVVDTAKIFYNNMQENIS